MSRDYQEDQKNELEALESIYFDELESKTFLTFFKISLKLKKFQFSTRRNEESLK